MDLVCVSLPCNSDLISVFTSVWQVVHLVSAACIQLQLPNKKVLTLGHCLGEIALPCFTTSHSVSDQNPHMLPQTLLGVGAGRFYVLEFSGYGQKFDRDLDSLDYCPSASHLLGQRLVCRYLG